MMKRLLTLLCLLPALAGAAVITNVGSTTASWTNATAWVGGAIPTGVDEAVITGGTVVVHNQGINVGTLSVLGGTLTSSGVTTDNVISNKFWIGSANSIQGKVNWSNSTVTVFGDISLTNDAASSTILADSTFILPNPTIWTNRIISALCATLEVRSNATVITGTSGNAQDALIWRRVVLNGGTLDTVGVFRGALMLGNSLNFTGPFFFTNEVNRLSGTGAVRGAICFGITGRFPVTNDISAWPASINTSDVSAHWNTDAAQNTIVSQGVVLLTNATLVMTNFQTSGFQALVSAASFIESNASLNLKTGFAIGHRGFFMMTDSTNRFGLTGRCLFTTGITSTWSMVRSKISCEEISVVANPIFTLGVGSSNLFYDSAFYFTNATVSTTLTLSWGAGSYMSATNSTVTFGATDYNYFVPPSVGAFDTLVLTGGQGFTLTSALAANTINVSSNAAGLVPANFTVSAGDITNRGIIFGTGSTFAVSASLINIGGGSFTSATSTVVFTDPPANANCNFTNFFNVVLATATNNLVATNKTLTVTNAIITINGSLSALALAGNPAQIKGGLGSGFATLVLSNASYCYFCGLSNLTIKTRPLTLLPDWSVGDVHSVSGAVRYLPTREATQGITQ